MLTQRGLRRLKLLLVGVQRIVLPYRGRHSVAAADAYAAVADWRGGG